jgi:hypothetical protein
MVRARRGRGQSISAGGSACPVREGRFTAERAEDAKCRGVKRGREIGEMNGDRGIFSNDSWIYRVFFIPISPVIPLSPFNIFINPVRMSLCAPLRVLRALCG